MGNQGAPSSAASHFFDKMGGQVYTVGSYRLDFCRGADGGNLNGILSPMHGRCVGGGSGRHTANNARAIKDGERREEGVV